MCTMIVTQKSTTYTFGLDYRKDIQHQPGFCQNERNRDFLVIGHAGGDPLGHCENTIEATRSALKLGANAIEVDIAISKDDVIFLWHDPNPLGWHSLARR